MKVISVNLNGIRAAARKGFYEWLPKVDADIVCLQELKAQPDQIEGLPYHPPQYHTYFHAAEKKGYSGVGVASLYMPSGSSKEERQEFKIDMMGRFEAKLKELADSGRQVIICGDWNIVHKKRDIKNWRGNQKRSGFLPEERQWMDWLYGEAEPELEGGRGGHAGFHDAFRIINDQDEQYTWWSNRGQAWANNTGWRIDYQVISDNLKDKVITGSELIYKDERFSDHAPLVIEYDI